MVVFSIDFFMNFDPEMAQNQSGVEARERQEIDKKRFGCSVDAFGCLGVPADVFFVDFASNLTRNLYVFSELLLGIPLA